MNEHRQTQQIDIYRVLRLTLRQAKRLWFVVVILAVGAGALLGIRAYRAYSPIYQATATYAASSGVAGVTDIMTNTSYYDTQIREQIVSSFSYIMGSEAMTERVKEELNLPYIPGSVTASSVGDTSFYKLTASGSDPGQTLALLEAVVKHYQETASFVIGNAVLEEVETPRVGSQPINGFSVRNSVLKGILLGLALGVCVLVFAALNHKTVESSEDLRQEVKLSCLGSIPFVETKKRRNSASNLVSLLNPRAKGILEASVSDLRLKLMRRAKKQNPEGKVLMVTSTYASEGKTTVSINLAISLAKSGKRVLLVDADLRNQNVKNRFGIQEPTNGLLDLVESDSTSDLSDYLVQIANLPLYLLAGDRKELSPLAQLESERMGEILDQLRKLTDVVILDAPPAGLLVDASILGKYADYGLYVVRYDGASVHQVADSIQELQRQNVELLGYVINGTKTGNSRYGSYRG